MKKTYLDYEEDRRVFLDDHLKGFHWVAMIMYYLCILQVRCVPAWDWQGRERDYVVETRLFNPWNPLSYFLSFISFIGVLLYYIWVHGLGDLFTREAWEEFAQIKYFYIYE